MGGNVFKNSSTRRVSAAEFVGIRERVVAQLTAAYPHRRIEVLPSYGNKPDFGNLSVFVEGDAIVSQLLAVLSHGRSALNNERLSLEHEGFQVDISFVPASKFDTVLAYHSFNGMGGLIGKVAHSLGLVLQQDRMFYKDLDGDQLVAEIDVANTWQQVLMLLGYSYARWSKGFASLDEMFAFIASSDFFEPADFMSVKPVVDGERPTVVQLFASYLQSASRPAAGKPENLLELLYDRIPGFQERHREVMAQWSLQQERRQAVRAKFNGQLVSEWTGRTGRELGNLMADIERKFGGKDAVHAWAYQGTMEEIRLAVILMHEADINVRA
jgi:hypothetical protein